MASKDLTFNLFGRDVNASTAMRKVAASAEESSRGMKRSFGELPKLAAEATAGAAAASVYLAAKFQQTSTRLVTDAGESAGALAKVRDGMLNISSSTGLSADHISSAMYTVESAGYHGAKGLAVLQAVAEGSKIGMADAHTVADALTTTLTDFGKAAGSPAQAMSMLTATVATGKTTMEELAGSLHSVLPAAASAGLGLKEVLAAVGTMTGEGISADQATQNLNHAILSLQAPSNVAREAMANIGVSSLDVAQHLGKRGLAGTYELLLGAMAKHSKAGAIVVNAFNESRTASASAQAEIAHMPASLQAVARQYEAGKLTSKQWSAELKGQPALVANLGKQFATTVKHADGFSSALKSGNSQVRTNADQLEKMTGGITGLQVALHLTGDHLSVFKKNTDLIGRSTAEAGGHVRGWAETQKNFNQQLAQAGATMAAVGIQVGTVLLPPLTKGVQAFGGFFTALRSGNPAARTFATAIALVAGALTAAFLIQKTYAAAAMVVKAAQLVAAAASLTWRGVLLLLKAEIIVQRGILMAWMLATRLAAAAQTFLVGTLIRGTAAWVASKVQILANAAALTGSFIASVAKSAAGLALQGAAVAASSAAFIAQRVVMLAGAAATGIATIATTAFGIAIDIATGPIGLIILAIGALIAVIVLLVTHWSQVCAFIQNVWGAVCKWFQDSLNSLVALWTAEWNFIVNVVRTVFAAIVAAIHAYLDMALGNIRNIVGSIKNFFAGAAGWLLDAGRNIIQGLINGITGMIGTVTSTVSNIAGGVIGTFKNMLGIHSPSRVFHTFGQNIGDGLKNGLLGSMSQVQGASNRLANTVIGMFEKRKGGISHHAESLALHTISRDTAALEHMARTRAGIEKNLAASEKQYAADRKARWGVVSSVRDATMNAGNIIGMGSAGDMVGGLVDMVAHTKRFTADLKRLSKMGVGGAVFDQLVKGWQQDPTSALAAADSLVANPMEVREIAGLEKQLQAAGTSLGWYAGNHDYGARVSRDAWDVKHFGAEDKVEGWKMQHLAEQMVRKVAQETHVHIHLTGSYAGTQVELGKSVIQAIRAAQRSGQIPKNALG